MNGKRCALSAIVVFVVIFVLDFVTHGFLLKEQYIQTSHLWRSESDYMFIYMLLGQIAIAATITYIFTQNYEGKGSGEGLRFGLYIGILLACPEFMKMAYMPITLMLTLCWVIGTLVKGVACGLALSMTYKK